MNILGNMTSFVMHGDCFGHLIYYGQNLPVVNISSNQRQNVANIVTLGAAHRDNFNGVFNQTL